jgi:hypothetical protein
MLAAAVATIERSTGDPTVTERNCFAYLHLVQEIWTARKFDFFHQTGKNRANGGSPGMS